MEKITVITGASGVGKTSLIAFLITQLPASGFNFYRFDTVGVPSLEKMTEDFGSPAKWQEAKTYEWIKKLVREKDERPIIFEGQMNVDFILGAFAKSAFEDFQIVLLDCSEAEMKRRLIKERNQPELANPDMSNWLRFLREQAKEKKIPIIDTTDLSIGETARAFLNKIEVHDH